MPCHSWYRGFVLEGGRIRPWSGNGWYWEYCGEPVLLLGGSDEDNLFNHPVLMEKNLDVLVKCGGNYVRCTLSCRDPGNVWPFVKTDGGYDLSSFNPEFWRRVRRFLREACKRDIVVQIEVWDPHDFWDWGLEGPWRRNPWNPSMNFNYSSLDTRLEGKWPHHPSHRPNPFFLAPKLRDEKLLEYQERFVDKVLEETVEFPNVLYCIDNETRAPPEWTLYWANYIKGKEREFGVKIQLTEMWDPWDLRHRLHRVTYSHPELFTFFEASQNNWNRGFTHYERLIWLRQTLVREWGAVPINNVKVYGAPAPREAADPQLNVERFWKCLFAGCASARFHRPPTGLGLSRRAQAAIAAAKSFASRFNFFLSEPRPDLVEAEREVYCLAEGEGVYAVYLPRGGVFKLKPVEDGSFECFWFNEFKRRFTARETAATRGGELQLKAPSENEWLGLVSSRA